MFKMKKIIFIFVTMILLISCDENANKEFDGSTFAYFKESAARIPIENGNTGSVEIPIGVTSTSESDRNITMSVVNEETTADSALYSFDNTTVTIPAGEFNTSFIMNAVWDNIYSTESRIVTLKLDSVDNGEISTDYVTVKIEEGCNPDNLLILTINFDGYSEEESWELRDSNNSLVMSNAYGAGVSTTSEEVCIEDGTYTFTIFDSYGDGLYDGVTTGNYELSKGSTIYASGSGNFGSSESTTFTK